MKSQEEIIKFEFDDDKDQMIKEIIRLREKINNPLYPVYPQPVWPGQYDYPWILPQTWCSTGNQQ